jgi:hypothetical protein
MNIFNFFKEKSLVVEDSKHNITGFMQELPISELQALNEEKLTQAKEYLGEKYILHPVHSVKKQIKVKHFTLRGEA